MLYLIDGHNLIGKIPGLKLSDLDDEERLVEMLQCFCRVERHTVEVFFDQAPPTKAGTSMRGMITVHAVRKGKTADDAIKERLHALERAAKNVRVVSSDRQVQAEARACGAEVISSEDIAPRLLEDSTGQGLPGKEPKKTRTPAAAPKPRIEPKLSTSEVDEWMQLFRDGKDQKKQK